MEKTRRNFLLGTCGAAFLAMPTISFAQDKQNVMNVLDALKTRRSVRSFTSEPVSDKDLRTMLEAAMLAPSAANEQPWEFVVFRDTDTLDQIPQINHYAASARNAPMAILVCLNTEKEKEKGMGILDTAICAENLMLAAHGLGLGSVFTGIYPIKERIEGYQKLAGLPESVIPIGLVVVGHPAENTSKPVPDRYNEASVHMEKWQGK